MPVALPEMSDLLSYCGPFMSEHALLHLEHLDKGLGCKCGLCALAGGSGAPAADADPSQCQPAAEAGLSLPAAAAPEQVRFHRLQVTCCTACVLVIYLHLPVQSSIGPKQLLKG